MGTRSLANVNKSRLSFEPPFEFEAQLVKKNQVKLTPYYLHNFRAWAGVSRIILRLFIVLNIIT